MNHAFEVLSESLNEDKEVLINELSRVSQLSVNEIIQHLLMKNGLAVDAGQSIVSISYAAEANIVEICR
jgi:hypothetical protein